MGQNLYGGAKLRNYGGPNLGITMLNFKDWLSMMGRILEIMIAIGQILGIMMSNFIVMAGKFIVKLWIFINLKNLKYKNIQNIS